MAARLLDKDIDLAKISSISLTEGAGRLKSRGATNSAVAAYREAVSNLTPDKALELEPELGESLRKLRINITRAAMAVGRTIAHGESDSGTLLVWLQGATKPSRRTKLHRASSGS